MDRRGFLTMFGSTMIAGTHWLHASAVRTPLLPIATSLTPVAATQVTSTAAYDAKLQAEMQQMAKRVYSEEGIAMILACEDLTANKPVAPSSSKHMNEVTTAALQKYVDSWKRQHPDAPAGDVAKLVELLAYKDFASGGKDTDL